MFDPQVLATLAREHEGSLRQLLALEEVLNRRFIGLEEAIHALILAVASGEPLLLIGPPGTAKSRLVRAFCGCIGLIDENAFETPDEDVQDASDQPPNGYFE